MARAKGSPRPCGRDDARARLEDARGFLEVAGLTDNNDVRAANASLAGIAAADAICCLALRERSADADHTAAVALLRRVDARAASILARLLDIKTQASYESRDVTAQRATAAVEQATRLVTVAETRLLQG